MSFRHGTAGTPASEWEPWRSALEELDPLRDPTSVDRVVLVAAYPDDQTLGAGGLLHLALRRGLEVEVVVAVPLGERGQPSSPPDGPERLTARLVDVIGDGRDTLVVAPWRHDGHPEHEAAGAVAAAAAQRTGARLVEYPVWFWHGAVPEEGSVRGFAGLRLDAGARAAKARAVAGHRAQSEPLSDRPGAEVLLDEGMLAHFLGPIETFVVDAPRDTSLEELHRSDADPWGVEDRWYEQRKRDLVLAVLPRRRFRRAVEIGCSTGALTLALARRCEELVALDASPTALSAARARLADQTHVEFVGAVAPAGWPAAGGVDLVVLSEVGYFLSPVALEALAQRVRADLTEDGVVLLCHWRHEIEGWVMNAAEVHERAVAGLGLPVLATYADRDVELLLLGRAAVLPDPQA